MKNNVIRISDRKPVAAPQDEAADKQMTEHEWRIWWLGYSEGAADEKARIAEEHELVLKHARAQAQSRPSHLTIA